MRNVSNAKCRTKKSLAASFGVVFIWVISTGFMEGFISTGFVFGGVHFNGVLSTYAAAGSIYVKCRRRGDVLRINVYI